eukprot:5329937-Pleurochrysis_carterae.AAC.1
MGEWRHPFCRMVGYSSGELLGLYSPNVKRKALYRMVTAFCRMVNIILQNSLCIVFRYGEQVNVPKRHVSPFSAEWDLIDIVIITRQQAGGTPSTRAGLTPLSGESG